jgi:trehalose 6-phosphate phosphatase
MTMEYLGDKKTFIKNYLEGKSIFLFLDYDGTLAPITSRPELAMIPINTRRALVKLCSNPRMRLAIVSGRSAGDLKARMSLRNAIYVGNHGWEIKEEGRPYKVNQSREARYGLFDVYQTLLEKVGNMPGVIVENKGFTLSVHYRRVNFFRIPHLKSTVGKILSIYRNNNILQNTEGDKVIEISPVSALTRGGVARQLFDRESQKKGDFMPVCIANGLGEELFDAFAGEGLNIRVGRNAKSGAGFYLNDIDDVQELLHELSLHETGTNRIKNK